MDFKKRGAELRESLKSLVYEYMLNNEECKRFGMKQSEIFRDCGMDWGDKENCTPSNQQYYIVAILRELEEEGKIQRELLSKKWRLKYIKEQNEEALKIQKTMSYNKLSKSYNLDK